MMRSVGRCCVRLGRVVVAEAQQYVVEYVPRDVEADLVAGLAPFGIEAASEVPEDRGPGMVRVSRTGGALRHQKTRDGPEVLVETWGEGSAQARLARWIVGGGSVDSEGRLEASAAELAAIAGCGEDEAVDAMLDVTRSDYFSDDESRARQALEDRGTTAAGMAAMFGTTEADIIETMIELQELDPSLRV